MCGLAPGSGFPRQGRAQAAGHPCCRPEVGEPRPGEETVNSDDHTVASGGHGREPGCGRRVHLAVQPEGPFLVQETHGHGAGVHLATTGNGLWRGGEAPVGSSSCVSGAFPHASIPRRDAEEGASISIMALQRTGCACR